MFDIYIYIYLHLYNIFYIYHLIPAMFFLGPSRTTTVSSWRIPATPGSWRPPAAAGWRNGSPVAPDAWRATGA